MTGSNKLVRSAVEIGVVVNPEAVVMLSQLSSGFVSFPYSPFNINCLALFPAKRRILLGTWIAIFRTEADFQTYWLLFDDRLCQSLCLIFKRPKRNTQIFAHRFYLGSAIFGQRHNILMRETDKLGALCYKS